ncbi:MAG: ThiF family adenylyltransferase [Actinobacteria bacterium]|nr:ThiF family adenylyltransferase [Actinomycetota bacterium]
MFPPLVEAGVELPPERAARFARHLALPGIGALGQRRIAAARVLVVGAGGLGAPVIQYLAAAGVGRIKIVDDDHVERTNLQRQVLHAEGDVGRPKAESAREAVAALDAAVRVETVVGRLGPDNALALFAAHDLVLDGSDNFATRYLCSDAAELTGTPVVWASILRFAGQLSVFWPGRGPMLRDLFPEIPDEDEALDCATGGVFGALCGVVGSAMAVEALKLVCGVGEPLVGRLARYDALAARWDELRFEADPARAAVTSLAEVAAVCRIPAGSAGRADDISVGEVAARLAADSRGLVVVDVRTADERSAGAIPGSVHVPLETILTGGWAVLAATLGDAATDGRDIVVTCQAGVRSARAIDALRESAPAGSALRNLAGGVAAWR